MKKKVFLLIFCLTIPQINTIIANEKSSLIIDFSENILLSRDDDKYLHHVEPTIAVSANGTIFTGWKDANTHNGAGIRVSFSKSIDNGVNWSDPLNMPNFIPNTGQSDPWLVWYEETETLYYAYLEYSLDLEEGFSQITVAKSTDYGKTWTPVTASHGIGFADKETMTASSDGILYVVYDDINMTSGTTFVRLTRSDDGGNTFNEISLITDSISYPLDHLAPYITTDRNNNVFVAWFWFTSGIWGDIFVTSSYNQGQNFTFPIDINQDGQNSTFESSPDQNPSKASLPVLQFDQNDRLYVLWAEKFEPYGLWDIYLRYSDDLGLTWSKRHQVNPKSVGNQWQPDMAVDSQGNLHIVYYDDEGGSSFKPFYRSLQFPQTGEPLFNNPIDISNGISTSNVYTRPGDYFTIRMDSNDVPHVVWSDGRNDEMDIYYAHGIKSTENPTNKSISLRMSIFQILTLIFLFKLRRRR